MRWGGDPDDIIVPVVLMRPTTTFLPHAHGTSAPTGATLWVLKSVSYFSTQTPLCLHSETPLGNNKAGAPFGGAWVGSGD
jgi:hypothetical protein